MDREELWKHLKACPGENYKWPKWKEGCLEFGPDCIPLLLEILENESYVLHYGAVNALRTFGYEVWAHGFNEDRYFIVKAPGESEESRIVPKFP